MYKVYTVYCGENYTHNIGLTNTRMELVIRFFTSEKLSFICNIITYILELHKSLWAVYKGRPANGEVLKFRTFPDGGLVCES